MSRAALGGAYWYFTAPFVRGGTLGERLKKEGKLPIPSALSIATKLADALGYAHERAVLHRDVKPSNVFLADDGRVLLADFGVARGMESSESSVEITATGTVVGTPQYMSPEQMSGNRNLDGRADQYSLACLMYEMLTGSPPFVDADTRTVLLRHLKERPSTMRTGRDTIPPGLDAASRNPNVFYELGMSHAIGKNVILLTQRGEDVPFDVTHLRYIKYDYTSRGRETSHDACRNDRGDTRTRARRGIGAPTKIKERAHCQRRQQARPSRYGARDASHGFQ